MSVDHGDAALQGQDGVRIDLSHDSLHAHLNLAFDVDHHSLDSDAGLVELNAALTHLQLDGLHGLFLALPHTHLSGAVAHLDGERFVALCDGDVTIVLDGDG